ADTLGVAHAGDALQLVDDVNPRVVVQVGRIVPRVLGAQTDDREDVCLGLGDGDALTHDLLGELGRGEVHLILDVDRREVEVAGEVEVDLQVHRPVAGVGRLEVQEAVQSRQLLLDGRCDGRGDVLGGGAGIGRRHLYR